MPSVRTLPFALLALLTVVLAVAAWLDPSGTTGSTAPHVYGQWWFVALWIVFVQASCVLIYKRKLWKRPATMALHLSFLVILLGAFATHLTSHRGFVHLREGEVAHQYMYHTEDGLALRLQSMPFLMALDSFRVEFDADGQTPADYISYVTIVEHQERRQVAISMNRIAREQGFRIFQTSYDEDLHGTLLTVSYDPWGTPLTYLGYLMLAVSMIWQGTRRQRVQDKGTSPRSTPWPMILLGTLLASYMVVSIALRPLVPVLRSPLLFVHVGTIMISYILLVVSIVVRRILRYAVFFLMAGIFLGAIWANVSWGSYWSWDPKETWALITLLVYSVPLHQESLPWFHSDRHYRLYSVFCLLCLLMTYFGVTFLLGGMHSYAS